MVMVQNFRRAPCCLFLSFVLVCLSNKLAWSSFAPADTVIVNAGIYTVNPQRLWAEAFAIHIQVFTHAIGDRAIRLALDAYEWAQTANHTKDARHRIERIEDVSEHDIPRFGQLGVIASMQPLHAYPGDDTLKIWARNVGPERAQRAWVFHSIETTGGKLAFGSDWPGVTLNPWPGVQNAIARQTIEGDPPDGFVPNERISLEDTIKAYTLGAAFGGRCEKTEGSLEPGKLADLIVLSQDLFKIKPSEIGKTEVLTMVGGKVVYQSPTGLSPEAK